MSFEGRSTSVDLDIRDVVSELWRFRYAFLLWVFLIAVSAFVALRYVPDYYRSEVLLAPAADARGGGLGALASQMTGLAGLAGISLDGIADGGVDRTSLALAVLESRAFLAAFLERSELSPRLLAAKRWDRERDLIEFDPEIWREDAGGWQGSWKSSASGDLLIQTAHAVFLEDHLEIEFEGEGGLISVTVEHVSPHVAHEVLTELIRDLNERIRLRDKARAEGSLAYLKEQVEETNVAELRAVLFQLMEEQTKRLMLTEQRGEYALQIVDPPSAPELPAGPPRMLALLASCVLAAALFMIFIIVWMGFAVPRGDEDERVARPQAI